MVTTRTASRFRTSESSREGRDSAERIRETRSPEEAGVRGRREVEAMSCRCGFSIEGQLESKHVRGRFQTAIQTYLESPFPLSPFISPECLLQPHESLARLPPLPAHPASQPRRPIIVFQDAPSHRNHILLRRRRCQSHLCRIRNRSGSRRCRRSSERVTEFDVENRDDGVVLFCQVVKEDGFAEALLRVGARGGRFDDAEKVGARVGEVEKLEVAFDLAGLCTRHTKPSVASFGYCEEDQAESTRRLDVPPWSHHPSHLPTKHCIASSP